MDKLSEIRKAEALSHIETYSEHELFKEGSWLAKPVKTVMELLPFFNGYDDFRALDLGCGIGRNSIPVAQALSTIPCHIDSVDILEIAIVKLNENAKKYGVEKSIIGIVSSIDDYIIDANRYDLIMSISALEHVDSKQSFVKKLEQIHKGIKPDGIVCLIMNTSVKEHDKETGIELPTQFEVELETTECRGFFEQFFGKWETIKDTVVRQKYDVPRENGMAELESDVVTFVARRVA